MILKDVLRSVVRQQRKDLDLADTGIKREILRGIDLNVPHAIILSGIRRCGKSTLLRQIIKRVDQFYYFNFEDQRTIGFDLSDFEKLNDVLHEEFGDSTLYFFDEMQNVPAWERVVRKMLDAGKKCVITGSNASLLSKELGTKLTGRHLTYELFPFSYAEMLALTSQKPGASSFEGYMKNGGFPEFLRYKKTEILQELLNDIVIRDIITRHKLRQTKIIQQMAVYLLTNVGKEFSYNNLAKYFRLGSVNTVISYLSYFEDSYLVFTVPKFDYSYRRQVANPKKIYSIDVGLSAANSASFSEDTGRVLENVAFLALRRKYKDIYYFRGKGECDFLVRDRGKMQAIQVCSELTPENQEREIGGLKEAMEKLKLKSGIVLTRNQEDRLKRIEIKPLWKWLVT